MNKLIPLLLIKVHVACQYFTIPSYIEANFLSSECRNVETFSISYMNSALLHSLRGDVAVQASTDCWTRFVSFVPFELLFDSVRKWWAGSGSPYIGSVVLAWQ